MLSSVNYISFGQKEREGNYLLFSGNIDGSENIPVNISPRSGTYFLHLDKTTNVLSYLITLTGLPAGITEISLRTAHPTANGPLIHSFPTSSTTIRGSVALTNEQAYFFSAGNRAHLAYIQVQDSSGGIRGSLTAFMELSGIDISSGEKICSSKLLGSSVVPPASNSNIGQLFLHLNYSTREIHWFLTHDVSGAISIDFKSPAYAGLNAPSIVDIDSISGTLSPIIGKTTITNSQMEHLLAGRWYVQIDNAIRGQIQLNTPDNSAICTRIFEHMATGGITTGGDGIYLWFKEYSMNGGIIMNFVVPNPEVPTIYGFGINTTGGIEVSGVASTDVYRYFGSGGIDVNDTAIVLFTPIIIGSGTIFMNEPELLDHVPAQLNVIYNVLSGITTGGSADLIQIYTPSGGILISGTINVDNIGLIVNGVIITDGTASVMVNYFV